MIKRIISLAVALLLCLSLTIPAFATIDDYRFDFIIDEHGNLSTEEVGLLNEQATKIYNTYDVGVFFVFTYADYLADYDIEPVVGDLQNYVIMLENEDSWYMHLGGSAFDVIDESIEESLRSIYDAESTYYFGVSAFLEETSKLFPEKSNSTASENIDAVITPGATETRLFDEADLLTEAEETTVLSKLNEVSELHKVDVIVATVESVGDLTPDQYVNSFYDANNLGYGDNKDGVLLLLSMEERDYRILSNGIAGDAISLDDIDTIGNKIIDDLGSGDYVSAFTKFADECEYYINGEINGFPFNAGKNLLISLAIGFVVAFIVTGKMRGQLKSVRAKAEASDYVKSGSMHVTHSSDLFLYRNVTRTKKAENSSSSSGSSRNVGGGKF